MSFIVVTVMYVRHLWKINLSKVVTLLIFHLQLPSPWTILKKKKKTSSGKYLSEAVCIVGGKLLLL